VRRALYRFRDYPSSVHEEVMAAWLAVGANRSIISHESALELHDLTDVIPHSIHLTVDRSLRGLRPLASVTLHTTVHVLPDADVTIREGMRVTSPERSLLDAAAAGTAPEQIVLGVRTAIQRGWASPSGISQRAQARGGRVAHLVQVALREEGAHA
jgi:predicted transcriptional regulator of viral defense system